MIIDELTNRLLDMGIEIGTKDAVKGALQFIGADTSTIDEVYVELKNRLNKKAFSKIPFDRRALFVSHCMKSSEHCKAGITDDGIICEGCGSCIITKIKSEAERLGYKFYVVPGGSMVFKILERIRPEACMGVACYYELEEAFEKLTVINMPYQGVPLLRDGCKDTDVDLELVFKVMSLRDF